MINIVLLKCYSDYPHTKKSKIWRPKFLMLMLALKGSGEKKLTQKKWELFLGIKKQTT